MEESPSTECSSTPKSTIPGAASTLTEAASQQEGNDSEHLETEPSATAASHVSSLSDPEGIEETAHLPAHVVGIGGSAGSLGALQELFSCLPNQSGAAYVVAQHLSPDFKSVMGEILSKHTPMPIYNIQDGQPIEKDTVYVIPARKNLRLRNGRLYLETQDRDEKIHFPIDSFFQSLANDQQHRAVAIVLSGTGSDGSRGIRSIKEMGGLIIAQDPKEAQFNGMPLSAVDTGICDFILPVGLIPEQLIRFMSHPLISEKNESFKTHARSYEDTMECIFELLREQTQIDFSQYKASKIAQRIKRTIGIKQLTSLTAYYNLLKDSPAEAISLGKELLVNSTSFFRDKDAFKVVEERVVDRILDQTPPEKPIRIWCAGCSSGEEPYSIAILFREALERRNEKRSIKIFATDVDDQVVAFASAGKFPIEISKEVSAERIERHFTLSDKHYLVKNELRLMVVFSTHDIVNDPPFSNIDFVICRNLLDYLHHNAQKKVLIALHFALKKNGYLFLGQTESLTDLHAHFNVISDPHKIYCKLSNVRIPIGAPPPFKSNPSKNLGLGGMKPVTNLLKAHRSLPTANSPMGLIQDALVRHYVSPCIVLNQEFEAQHVFGDVSKFMKPFPEGKVTNNINSLISDELSVAVSTALAQVKETEKPILYAGLALSEQKPPISINLEVLYIREQPNQSGATFFVLVFHNTQNDADDNLPKKIKFDMEEQSRKRIKDLEEELQKKQEYLQITVEELETTNEELHSANEELMSANEELQSTNEELQSVNEELYTVNIEFQSKINELTHTNTDLDSVLDHSGIGVLLLDDHLQVRRFTALAKQYFKLVPEDISRPIYHLNHKLDYDSLIKDVQTSSQQNKSITKRVLSDESQIIEVSIFPSKKQHEGEHDGLYVTLKDCTFQCYLEHQSYIRPLEVPSCGTPLKATPKMLLWVDNQSNESLGKRKTFVHLKGKLAAQAVNIHSVENLDHALTWIKQNPAATSLTIVETGSKTHEFHLAVDKLKELEQHSKVVMLNYDQCANLADKVKSMLSACDTLNECLNIDYLNTEQLEQRVISWFGIDTEDKTTALEDTTQSAPSTEEATT